METPTLCTNMGTSAANHPRLR